MVYKYLIMNFKTYIRKITKITTKKTFLINVYKTDLLYVTQAMKSLIALHRSKAISYNIL